MIDSHFSYDLPEDLFEDGETKPTKPQKKKQSNKRTSTEVCTFFYALLELTTAGPCVVQRSRTACGSKQRAELTLVRTRRNQQQSDSKPLW